MRMECICILCRSFDGWSDRILAGTRNAHTVCRRCLSTLNNCSMCEQHVAHKIVLRWSPLGGTDDTWLMQIKMNAIFLRCDFLQSICNLRCRKSLTNFMCDSCRCFSVWFRNACVPVSDALFRLYKNVHTTIVRLSMHSATVQNVFLTPWQYNAFLFENVFHDRTGIWRRAQRHPKTKAECREDHSARVRVCV